MSPSLNHEVIKEFIGILIVGYCEKFEIDYYPMGSTTQKRKDKLAAKEPDISYFFGESKQLPDLAIEVVFTSGNKNDLEKYRRLEVQEVWFWIEDNLEVYIIDQEQYYRRDISSIFPLLKFNSFN
jgi:Uma2 family endonuclease